MRLGNLFFLLALLLSSGSSQVVDSEVIAVVGRVNPSKAARVAFGYRIQSNYSTILVYYIEAGIDGDFLYPLEYKTVDQASVAFLRQYRVELCDANGRTFFEEKTLRRQSGELYMALVSIESAATIHNVAILLDAHSLRAEARKQEPAFDFSRPFTLTLTVKLLEACAGATSERASKMLRSNAMPFFLDGDVVKELSLTEPAK